MVNFLTSAISPGIFRDRVSKITRDLIQIDTTNYGGIHRRTGRRAWQPDGSHGDEPEIIESEPGRASVVGGCVAGMLRLRLVLHGHIDVVPLMPANGLWIRFLPR